MNEPQNSANSDDLATLRTCRTLITFANVLGPLSLLLGGVLMGTAGLVCAIIARVKASRLTQKTGEVASEANRYLKSSVVSIGICLAAILINAIAIYLFMPQFLGMLQNMDLSSLGVSGIEGASGGTGSTSTWG